MRMIQLQWQPPSLREDANSTPPDKRKVGRIRLTPMEIYKKFEEMVCKTAAHEATIFWAVTRMAGYSCETISEDPTVAVELVTREARYLYFCDQFNDPIANLKCVTEKIRTSRSAGIGTKDVAFIHRTTKLLSSKRWMKLLGLDSSATKEDILSAFRRKVITAHPDHGGNPDEFRELIDLRDEALREVDR